MITHHPVYFEHLQHAIELGSLPRVQSALAEISADYLSKKDKVKFQRATEVNCLALALVDIRGRDDITPLMLTCALYREKVRQGDRQGCAVYNEIAAWLIQEQAFAGAEGHRPVSRRVDRNTGRTVYVWGRGRNLVEAMGWEYLPPSVRRHLRRRCKLEKEQAQAA